MVKIYDTLIKTDRCVSHITRKKLTTDKFGRIFRLGHFILYPCDIGHEIKDAHKGRLWDLFHTL